MSVMSFTQRQKLACWVRKRSASALVDEVDTADPDGDLAFGAVHA